MSSILYFNSANIVSGTNNSTLRYNLGTTLQLEDNYEVAISSIHMYNAIFNINSTLYRNNQFQYYWLNSSGVVDFNTPYTITIDDGMYTTSTLNQLFINAMTANKHYLVSTSDSTSLTFFYTIQNNLANYRVQLISYKFITRDQVTGTDAPYAYPSGGVSWVLPLENASQVGAVRFMDNNFSNILGFNKNQRIPSTNQTSTTIINGDFAPVQSPVTSLLVTSNLVKNELSNPTNILHSMAFTEDFGELNKDEPNNLLFCPVQRGSYSFIELRFLDQDFRAVQIQDTQMLIALVIRKIKKDEIVKK